MPKPPRDPRPDLDDLVVTSEEHGRRIGVLEGWHDARIAFAKTWRDRTWVFASAVGGTVLAAWIVSRIVR